MEGVICHHGCVGKFIIDRRELHAKDSHDFFGNLDINNSL